MNKTQEKKLQNVTTGPHMNHILGHRTGIYYSICTLSLKNEIITKMRINLIAKNVKSYELFFSNK